jgi:hypothetical protein
MRFLLACFCLALCACDTDKVTQLEKENKELHVQLDKRSSVELQEKCAQQSASYFKEQGPWGKDAAATFANHYNQSLGKCFVEIIVQTIKPTSTFLTIFLTDAFEGKDYGNYGGRSVVPAVRPVVCYTLSSKGDQVQCNSQDEFETIAKSYMEQ